MLLAASLNRSRMLVHGINCTDYLERQVYLPCLSWGEKCLSCVDESVRAPNETYLLNQPYWSARISSEMREGIENLQSLYDRGDRSYEDGSPPTKGVSRRNARRDRGHPSSVESEARRCYKRVDTLATRRGKLSSILIVTVVQDTIYKKAFPTA